MASTDLDLHEPVPTVNLLMSAASGDPPWAFLSLSEQANKETRLRNDSATTPPRSILPGCLGLHGSEGVRTGWTSTPRASRGATAETTPENQRGKVQF